MKKLICCETPFQVIVSLFIRKQFTKPNDLVDLVILNTFSGYESVAKEIESKKIFHKVYIVKTKNMLYSKTILEYLNKLTFILFPKLMIKKRWRKNIELYDEMYCGNYDIFTASIRSYFAFRKHHIKFYLYDEGYMSYFPFDDVYPIKRFLKLLELKNNLIGLNKIKRKNIDGWLFFEPDWCISKPNCQIFRIDRTMIYDKKFKKLIDDIFKASNVLKQYDKKFIIFEEAILANNPNVDDEKMFDKIINIVGKDNVLIKLHPRTNEDRFTKKGIKTLGSDGIPWEALACVGDFQDKVLIAISSSSITTYRMLFGHKMNGYLLFKILNPGLNQFSSKYDEFWEKMKNITKDGGIHIPDFEKELNDLLSSSLVKVVKK